MLPEVVLKEKNNKEQKKLRDIYEVSRVWPFPLFHFHACSGLFPVKLDFPPGPLPPLDMISAYRYWFFIGALQLTLMPVLVSLKELAKGNQ